MNSNIIKHIGAPFAGRFRMLRDFRFWYSMSVMFLMIVIGFLSATLWWMPKLRTKPPTVVHRSFQDQDSVSRPDVGLDGYYEPKPGSVNIAEPEWLGKRIVHTINGDGLRASRDYIPDKPDGIFRIVALGDSFTYGLFVDDEETYTEKLENLLNTTLNCPSVRSFEVLNFGVPGYDIELSAQRYYSHAGAYRPDLVLWFVTDNDFSEYGSFVQSLWLEMKKMLFESRIPYEQFATESAELLTSSITYTLGEDEIRKHQAGKLDEWTKKISVPLVLFSQDTLPRQDKAVLISAVAGRPKSGYLSSLRYRDPLADGHPSPQNYSVIADTVFEYLVKNRFVPCN